MRKLMLISSLVAVSGCTLWTDWFPSAPPSNITQRLTRDVARVIPLPDCPVVSHPGPQPVLPLLAGAAAAAIPFVVNTAVDALKMAVQKAEDDLNAAYIAYGTGQLAARPLSQRCLVIARGTFPSQGVEHEGKKGVLDQKVLTAISASDFPPFYMEVWVDPDQNDRNRLVFEPVLFQFADTAAANPGNGTKSIGVVLAVSASPLELASNATSVDIAKVANATVPFDLGKIARGSWIQSDPVSVGRSPDIFLDQRRAVSLGAADKALVGTLDICAFITESDKPGTFYKVLLDASTDSSLKDALTTIGKSVIPSSTNHSSSSNGP